MSNSEREQLELPFGMKTEVKVKPTREELTSLVEESIKECLAVGGSIISIRTRDESTCGSRPQTEMYVNLDWYPIRRAVIAKMEAIVKTEVPQATMVVPDDFDNSFKKVFSEVFPQVIQKAFAS
jgi:hypothetical protein